MMMIIITRYPASEDRLIVRPLLSRVCALRLQPAEPQPYRGSQREIPQAPHRAYVTDLRSYPTNLDAVNTKKLERGRQYCLQRNYYMISYENIYGVTLLKLAPHGILSSYYR